MQGHFTSASLDTGKLRRRTYYTDRLTLIPMTPGNTQTHNDDLIELYQDQAFLRYLGEADFGKKPFQSDDIQKRVHNLAADWDEIGIGCYIVIERKTGEFAGRAGLRSTEVNGQPSIDYLAGFLEKHQGKGFGTEAGLFALAQGFELGIREIKSVTTEQNKPSQNMLRKLGFVLTQTEYKGMIYTGGNLNFATFKAHLQTKARTHPSPGT
ncbi:MAG: GNAT family N-acetyltransferase [Rhodospirillales bacterium]|nr:GNAT family N-acetyltransferase [Rhodospirillales bacterium]